MEEELGTNWNKVQQLLDEVGHERFGEIVAASKFAEFSSIDMYLTGLHEDGFSSWEDTSAFFDGFYDKGYLTRLFESASSALRRDTIADWAVEQLCVSSTKSELDFYSGARLFIDGGPWLLEAITSVISAEDINTQVPNYLAIKPNISINENLSEDEKDEALKHSLVLEFIRDLGELPREPEEFISATKTLDEERVNNVLKRTVIGFVHRIKV